MAHTLPFDMGKEELGLTLPVLLDNRTLTLRHHSVQKIFKLQEAVAEGFRKVAKELGCTEYLSRQSQQAQLKVEPRYLR